MMVALLIEVVRLIQLSVIDVMHDFLIHFEDEVERQSHAVVVVVVYYY
jgi:hypothetical protein